MRMLCSIALLAALATPALAGGASVTRFHDAAGRVTGTARTQDGRTTFYDPAGRVTGRAETRR